MGWRDAPVVSEDEMTFTPRSAPKAPDVMGDEGYFGFMNRGMVETALSPLDLAEKATGGMTRPLQSLVFGDDKMAEIDAARQAPSRTIMDLIGRLGTSFAPEGAEAELPSQRAGEVTGQILGILPAFVGGTKLAAEHAGGMGQDIAKSMFDAFTKQPAAAMGIETLAAVGGGAGNIVGGDLAAETLGEEYRSAGEFGGEVLGSLGLAAAPAMGKGAVKVGDFAMGYVPGYRLVADPVKDIAGRYLPGQEPYATRVAREELAKRAGDPEEALRNLDMQSELNLTPMTKTGDARLIQYESDIARSNPDTARRMDIAQRESLDLAQEKLLIEEFLGVNASPIVAKRTAQEHLKTAKDELDTALNSALDEAVVSITQAGPRVTESKSDNSALFAEVVEETFTAVNRQVNDAWSVVPKDDVVSTDGLKAAYDDVVTQAGIVGQKDIPPRVREVLDENSGAAYGDTIDGAELFKFYNVMTTQARKLRAENETDGARILSNMADAALQALDNHDTTSEAYKQARAMTRAMHDRFTRGSVGELRGYSKDGGQSTSDYTYLDRLLNKTGGSERQNLEDMITTLGNVVDSPIGPGRTRSAYDAAEDYIRGSFVESIQPDAGTTNWAPGKAENYLRRHNELFTKYPGLKTQFDDTIASVKSALALGKDNAASVKAIDTSPLGRYGSTRTDKEFDTLFNSAPPEDISDIVSILQSADNTGDALNGFKRSAAEYLIRQSRTFSGNMPTLDNPTATARPSSAKLSKTLTENRASLEAVFSPDEMGRLDRINLELSRLDAAKGVQGTPGQIVAPDLLGSIAGRFLGVRGAATTNTGSGTSSGFGAGSLQIYSAFARFGKSVADKLTTTGAERILQDALFDEQLFRSLLTPPMPESQAQAAQRYVSAWLAAMPVSVSNAMVEEADNFTDDEKINRMLEGLGD